MPASTPEPSPVPAAAPVPAEPPTRREAERTWLRIGLLSFGGPAAQIALLQRIVVEERRWISAQRFLDGLNLCTLLPGPEAQQLATYLGWCLDRTRGALIAGLLFILPGALCLLALSAAYALGGELAWVRAALLGVQAAALALVAQAMIRLGRSALTTPLAWAVAAAGLIAIGALAAPALPVIAAAGLIGAVCARWAPGALRRRAHAAAAEALADGVVDRLIAAGRLPHLHGSWRATLATAGGWLAVWLLPLAGLLLLLGSDHLLTRLALLFSEVAVVSFGGAYAVLALVAQAIASNGWLGPETMMAGLALAESTPGPLILVLQFVGALAAWGAGMGWAGLLAGGAIALWFTFAPCFLWILVAAPYVERMRQVPALAGALAAITAAVLGVIAALALWFAAHVLFTAHAPVAVAGWTWSLPVPSSLDPAALALAAAAWLALRRGLGVGTLVLAAAAVGTVIGLLRG